MEVTYIISNTRSGKLSTLNKDDDDDDNDDDDDDEDDDNDDDEDDDDDDENFLLIFVNGAWQANLNQDKKIFKP